MDEIREDKLEYYRRVENIIQNIEENEAKANEAIEAIRHKSKLNKTSIGPANDLLRYLYILEQQYQSDSIEIRTKARENVLEYIDQFRPSDDVTDDDDQTDEPQESESIVPSNSQPPITVSLPATAVFSPSIAAPSPTQPSTPVLLPQQPQTVASSLPSPVKSQALSIAPVTDPDHIKPKTLAEYEKLLFEAQQYEKRYTTIELPRKKQLASRIKNIMNKLRKDTYEILKEDLFKFLMGHEQQVSNQKIRVSNDEERLLCLSMLASLILAQLLGGDLNDIKTEIFLPLVCDLSENQQNKEFTIIFRERLHKKCPYTVPFYPKREPTMNDRKYLEAMGYVEKHDGDQPRLETDTEFLNRMSGLIRLFCKLLVHGGPPFDTSLSFAWSWFADVLNLPPRRNITSVLIRVFLDEASDKMMKTYGNSFSILIKTIQVKYLSRLKAESSDDQVARLQLTLDAVTTKLS